jgi:hypothetical protein
MVTILNKEMEYKEGSRKGIKNTNLGTEASTS